MSSPTILTLTIPESLQPTSLANGSCDLSPTGCTCCGQNSCSCCISNTLEQIFLQLATDSNSILLSRLQSQLDSNLWNALGREIGALVRLADASRNPTEQSNIYGVIMLIITSQYLPAVSNFIGDQISEQAAIQNMASDLSGFVIQAESAFNSLSSTPDCSCDESCSSSSCTNTCTTTVDCQSQYNLFSGIMTMIAGTSGSGNPPDSSGTLYSYSFSATIGVITNTTTYTENNVLAFLTDPNIWSLNGGSTPLSSSQSSQISTALLGITSIFNTAAANVDANAWNNMNLSNISSAICSWTQPYGSSNASDAITTGNAPLVYTEPGTIQADLNTAAQTLEGISTSTQTVENFQVQEVDQFYGITNSIQQSQEQQCASMVKQQNT